MACVPVQQRACLCRQTEAFIVDQSLQGNGSEVERDHAVCRLKLTIGGLGCKMVDAVGIDTQKYRFGAVHQGGQVVVRPPLHAATAGRSGMNHQPVC